VNESRRTDQPRRHMVCLMLALPAQVPGCGSVAVSACGERVGAPWCEWARVLVGPSAVLARSQVR
jgi:hypothetical protein